MKLYHYDHCPYCLRVRMIIGWKNLEVEQEILANADEGRHYDLIGAKIVPILQKPDGSYIKESLDIVAYIDQNFGQPLLQPNNNEALAAWLEKAAASARYLVHPRNIQIFTEDFPTQADRDYYENKKSQSIGSFAQALADSAKYIGEVALLLDALNNLLPQLSAGPSYDDILLFPVLRSLSHVKGLLYPLEVRRYTERVSGETAIPLLFDQAI